jgi:hypothetical protein
VVDGGAPFVGGGKVAGQAEFSSEHKSSCAQTRSVVGGFPVGKEEGGKSCFSILPVLPEDFLEVHLDRLDIALHHAVRLCVEGCCVRRLEL